MDGDEDGLEVGGEGLVELVVAGGGLAVVLHAVEDAFDHVPSLVRLPVVVPWVRAVPLGRHDRVLVDLHARGVHGEHPDLHPDDPLLLQCREQALHRAVPGPAVEPPADGDPLAVALRQVPPRGSRPAHPQQGVDEPVVVDRHVAALSRRRMRDPHEPVKRDAIPRRTHTTIITQNLNSINTPSALVLLAVMGFTLRNP